MHSYDLYSKAFKFRKYTYIFTLRKYQDSNYQWRYLGKGRRSLDFYKFGFIIEKI